jgi:hypothetical protein
MPEFKMGFSDLANNLKAHGTDPGQPVTDEIILDGGEAGSITIQATTTGLMSWASGAPPLFIPGDNGSQ